MKTLRAKLILLSLLLALFCGMVPVADQWSGVAAFAAPTTVPAPRDHDSWMQRHKSFNERIKQGNVDVLMIGDSITHGWEGGGKEVWAEYYAHRNAVNLGISGDRTEHVLWRLENGNIEGVSPKLAVIMIGTNNYKDNSAEEIAEGIKAIVAKLRTELPEMKILLLGIFPRAEKPGAVRDKLAKASALSSACADNKMVFYTDIGRYFLADNGDLPKEIMPDYLHPNAYGYQLWANAMEPNIARLLGEFDAGQAPIGFVPMCNGKDLTGWKGLVENPEKRAAMSAEELAKKQVKADKEMNDHWSVDDNTLIFDGHGNHLCTTRLYEDFEMVVDWKIEAKGDSGLYLRGSPQVQIWDPAQWPQGSGGLYNNKKNPSDPLLCADNPIGDWNTFRIKMVGEKVTVYLNDKLVVDNVVLENYWNRDIPIYPAEQIELQSHGSKVWFKNLFVRDIPRGEGWRDLFNGKDLTNWEQVGGEKQTWGAEDGMLFTDGEGGGWLSTTEEFGDFELELEFRVPPGGNSGVFIRAPRKGNPAFEGSEIQVLDDSAEVYKDLKAWQYCGSLYSTAAPARRVTTAPGTWQKMRIRCEGPKVQINLNGYDIVDANCDDHADKLADHPGLKRRKGFIGLQNHGSRLDYRNIRIREL